MQGHMVRLGVRVVWLLRFGCLLLSTRKSELNCPVCIEDNR